MLVVTGDQPPAVLGRGQPALRAGAGALRQPRGGARAAGPLPQTPCGEIGQCEFELFVSVPSLGRKERKPVRGDDPRRRVPRDLVSDRTRIPGLVSLDDIRETVEALGAGRDPPLEWRESEHPLEELRGSTTACPTREPRSARRRLRSRSRYRSGRPRAATRSALLARGALLFPLAAIALALCASRSSSSGPSHDAGRGRGGGGRTRGPAQFRSRSRASVLAATAVLALSPETNSLMAIGASHGAARASTA